MVHCCVGFPTAYLGLTSMSDDVELSTNVGIPPCVFNVAFLSVPSSTDVVFLSVPPPTRVRLHHKIFSTEDKQLLSN